MLNGGKITSTFNAMFTKQSSEELMIKATKQKLEQ